MQHCLLTTLNLFQYLQLMDSKAAELERLLSQLSDVNDSMKGTVAGRSDARSHTFTRHRDILHDYQQAGGMLLSRAAHTGFQGIEIHVAKDRCTTSALLFVSSLFLGSFTQQTGRIMIHTGTQEFRRHNSSLIASRDRVQLLQGSSERSPLIGSQGHSSGALLRERGQISSAHSAVSLLLPPLSLAVQPGASTQTE